MITANRAALACALFIVASAASAQPAPRPVQRELERARVQAPVAQPAPEEPASSANTVLPASAQWAPARIEVQRGARLQIAASPNTLWTAGGQQTAAARVAVPMVDANGHPNTAGQQGLPVPRGNRGALIGRIGDNGAPFLIGLSYDGVAEADGQLYLSMNDFADQFADNQGRIAIQVNVTPPPPVQEPAQPPVETPQAQDPTTQPETPLETPTATPAPDEPGVPGVTPPVQAPLSPMNIAIIAGVVLLGMFLFTRLFRARPREQHDDDPQERPAADISARIVSDGIAGQILTITMGRRA
ncbi:MAG: hypothetical protein AB7O98_02070 [Hyphomonadaceae bacterium]